MELEYKDRNPEYAASPFQREVCRKNRELTRAGFCLTRWVAWSKRVEAEAVNDLPYRLSLQKTDLSLDSYHNIA
jgi:hypothetical protein